MIALQKSLFYFVGLLASAAFALLGVEVIFPDLPILPYLTAANVVIHGLFVLDFCARCLSVRPYWKYIAQHVTDLWLFVPLVMLSMDKGGTTFGIVSREAALLLMMVSRPRRAQKLNNLLATEPALTMIGSFAIVVAGGAILLMLPAASATESPISWIDALFTSTSAVCVTGLTTLDTATRFSVFGQTVIALLIQVGGLGIMTFSACLALVVGRSMDVRQQVELQNVMDYDTLGGLKRLVFFIIRMTAIIELLGSVALFLIWRPRLGSFELTAYHAVFHSIAAFCNAGFSTFTDNLASFHDDAATLGVIAVLIVGGGLGFLVISDILSNTSRATKVRSRSGVRLRIQTKIVLWTSLILIVGGTILIYCLELRGRFAGASVHERIVMSVFQSVTARTAGFNSCDIGALTQASAFVLIVLMFIGASPGSTGGGIKTTTAAVLWATVTSTLRQRANVELFRRTIPFDVVRKSISVLCLSVLVVILCTAVLSITEKATFLDVGFETVSAFGTVGLSRNLTPSLTLHGKLIITVMMFIGRLGPLTMAYALTIKRQQAKYQYAEERVMIG
jgi:trk system potassium uptake protein